jgi:hypothetical protein
MQADNRGVNHFVGYAFINGGKVLLVWDHRWEIAVPWRNNHNAVESRTFFRHANGKWLSVFGGGHYDPTTSTAATLEKAYQEYLQTIIESEAVDV